VAERPSALPGNAVSAARWGPVVSLDRVAVSSDGIVVCPLREAQVNVADCLTCRRLERASGGTPPAYIVCDAREVIGWLGLDAPL
jgi:hypothetical protein